MNEERRRFREPFTRDEAIAEARTIALRCELAEASGVAVLACGRDDDLPDTKDHHNPGFALALLHGAGAGAQVYVLCPDPNPVARDSGETKEVRPPDFAPAFHQFLLKHARESPALDNVHLVGLDPRGTLTGQGMDQPAGMFLTPLIRFIYYNVSFGSYPDWNHRDTLYVNCLDEAGGHPYSRLASERYTDIFRAWLDGVLALRPPSLGGPAGD